MGEVRNKLHDYPWFVPLQTKKEIPKKYCVVSAITLSPTLTKVCEISVKHYYQNYERFEDMPYPCRGDNKWEWEYWNKKNAKHKNLS